MVRKALFEFKYAALIERGRQRTVHIVLQNRMCGIGKAQGGSGRAGGRSPVLESEAIRGEPVRANSWLTAGGGPRGWAYWRPWQQVGVDRNGQMSRMNVNVVCGNCEACSDFSLQAERDLLRDRTLIVILARKEDGAGRQGSRVGNGEAKLRQVRRC